MRPESGSVSDSTYSLLESSASVTIQYPKSPTRANKPRFGVICRIIRSGNNAESFYMDVFMVQRTCRARHVDDGGLE